MPTLGVSCVVTQMSALLERHCAVIYKYVGFLGLVMRVALIALLFLLPGTVYGDSLAAERDYRFGPIGAGWLPLTGDWDGNGTDTVGFYDPFTGTFFIKNRHAGGAADRVYRFGLIGAGWLPLTGDWDGNGTDTVGLYDPVISRFYLRNRHRSGVADVTYRFGPIGAGWLPLTGDWDGNGTATVGL